MAKKHSKSSGGSEVHVPHSLAELSAYVNTIAERSEDVSRRLRSTSDFVAQLVDVQQGVKRGARRVFRLRTIVIIALVVVAVLVVRAVILNTGNEPRIEPPREPDREQFPASPQPVPDFPAGS